MKTMLPGIVAGALAALSVVAAIFSRRAWLRSAQVERQIVELRSHVEGEGHRARADQEALLAAAADSRERVRSFAERTGAELQATRSEVDQLAGQVRALSTLECATAEAVSATAAKVATIADAVEIVTRKPLQNFPIDSGHLESKTPEEVLELAHAVAVLRPLVPYPKWRFDADWANPDLSFLLRQRLWQYFSDRAGEETLVVAWHQATKLRLYLGNDLSRQIFVAGCIDPNEFAFLDRFLQPGMTFFDAGANEGIYAIFAAKRVGSEGTVWAFEPSRREALRLQDNLDLNALRARIVPLALADCSGSAELTVAGFGNEGQNTLGAFAYEAVQATGRQRVQVARLDDVVSETPPNRIDVIKMDVEGAELRLLKGAEHALERYRPVLLFEVAEASLRHQGGSREELIRFLQDHHYVPYLFDPYSGYPTVAAPGTYSDNMLALPEGMLLPEAVRSPWPTRAAS